MFGIAYEIGPLPDLPARSVLTASGFAIKAIMRIMMVVTMMSLIMMMTTHCNRVICGSFV